MSILDKALGGMTPPESDGRRAEATAKARALAQDGDWLSVALDHHDLIRSAFETCREASDPVSQVSAMKALGLVLNGHSLAEEVVLYPALAKSGEKVHAGLAYTEQTTTKMQMAELERLPVGGEAWRDKLEHIRGAVLHHMYEEENAWFPHLKARYDDQAFLTHRFVEEYERYAGAARSADEPRSFEHPSGEARPLS